MDYMKIYEKWLTDPYFDEDTKAALLKKMYDFLEPGGYLFIGTTETLDKTRSAFQYVQPSIYRK